jgi:hypothetical protein
MEADVPATTYKDPRSELPVKDGNTFRVLPYI